MRTEAHFIEAIDCRFPYEREAEALGLIVESCNLSPNAVFTVVWELAVPPRDSHPPAHLREALLDQLDARFTHPLKPMLLGIARRILRSEPVAFDDCISALGQISDHPGLYSALNLVSNACWSVGELSGEQADTLCDEITAGWRRR